MPALPKVLSGLISNAMTAKAATEHAYEMYSISLLVGRSKRKQQHWYSIIVRVGRLIEMETGRLC